MPHDWGVALPALASFYGFQPEALWAMDIDEIRFWLDGAVEFNKPQ